MLIGGLAIVAILTGLGWYFEKQGNKRAKFITTMAIVIVVLGVVSYPVMFPPKAYIENETLVVTGMYGVKEPVSLINNLELVEELPRIQRRTNGISVFGTLIGHFKLDEWGTGKLFLQKKTGPFILIDFEDTFVVINYREENKTEEVYSQFATYVNK